jgi:hypothetical protein
MQYLISEFFGWNRKAIEEATQQQNKASILKLRARETAEKVKMCQGPTRTGAASPFPNKSS